MWTPFEEWQVAQLERLSHVDREATEAALNSLWDARPDLLERLTLSAIDEDQLSLSRAAEVLGISERGVEFKLAAHRRRTLKAQCIVVSDGSNAQMADGGLPIWEMVRVYRILGSIDRVLDSLSGVSRDSLESALAYADRNPDEIEDQIRRYESALEVRRAELP